MIRLKVARTIKTKNSTIGEMSINGQPFCFTLEDPIRDTKIAGETAIPAGVYKVIVNMSTRFKKEMPLLLAVPGFEGVRIHTGNYPRDTEGCLLVGMQKGQDCLMSSKLAYDALMAKLKGQTDITIEIC